ncbi:hypothetical protein ANABIO32_30290 [Rossellomorea marisflavi]|nr:hypothetical protein ANABIO32_30290 [Rossellomorea marisflavi]
MDSAHTRDACMDELAFGDGVDTYEPSRSISSFSTPYDTSGKMVKTPRRSDFSTIIVDSYTILTTQIHRLPMIELCQESSVVSRGDRAC